MIRKIIQIDTEKCNGCGLCAKACHEGAIGMVDGEYSGRFYTPIPEIGNRSSDVKETALPF